MSNVIEIKAFKTRDGKIFEKKVDADNHITNLDNLKEKKIRSEIIKLFAEDTKKNTCYTFTTEKELLSYMNKSITKATGGTYGTYLGFNSITDYTHLVQILINKYNLKEIIELMEKYSEKY